MTSATQPLDPSTEEEPLSLCCPITHCMYRDPVFVPESGTTYDREALHAFWRTAGARRDVLTNALITSDQVYVDWNKRREVAAWLSDHPGHQPAGWPDRTQPPPPAAEPPRRRLTAVQRPLVALGNLGGGLRGVLTLMVVAVALGCGLTGFAEANSGSSSSRSNVAYPDLGALSAAPRTQGRIALSSADSLLHARVSRAHSLGDGVGSIAMAVSWLLFTGFWTRGAYVSGAPLPFICFSAVRRCRRLEPRDQ